MFFKPQPVHFVGIGGIGMSGLAEILLGMGYPVSGSDLRASPVTEGLAARGATVSGGMQPQTWARPRRWCSAPRFPRTIPKSSEARRRGIPVMQRGELLAELMRLKFGIAVAGSHGKTTTTSMVAAIMTHAGMDPTVVVGGKVGMMGGANARLGKSEFLVVESDESDGSFLKLAPILAVVTNIDREHLDHYPDLDRIREAFTAFIGKLPFYGAAVLCLDDENIQRILPSLSRRIVTYGTAAQADLRVTHSAAGHMASRFQLTFRGENLGCFRLRVPGAHNALNAAAAAAIGLELEIPVEQIRAGLEQFTGVDRRFEIRGVEAGVTVIDDYGHHPTEIRATLAAARACNLRRIHVLFQPHRYTRTLALLDDFARAFNDADSVHVAGYLRRFGKAHRRLIVAPVGRPDPGLRPSRRALFGKHGIRHRRGAGAGARGRCDHYSGRGQHLAGRHFDFGRIEKANGADGEVVAHYPKSIAATVALTVVLLASMYAFHRLEQFLIRDPRFTLVGTGGDGLPAIHPWRSPARRTWRRAAIEAVFADDFGRSAYLLPLDDRRASLRTVDWVKDASVARFWPNRVVVGVTERTPVAFLSQSSGRASR